MPSVSAYAGSGGNNFFTASGQGVNGWSNTTNSTGAPNASYCNSVALGNGSITQSQDTWAFNPALPGGSVVTGMQIVVTALKTIATRGISFTGCILQIGGTTGTPTTTSANGSTLGTTAANYTWGSSTDLFGFSSGTLSVANINSVTKGTGPTIGVWCTGTSGSSASSAEVDAVQFTVFYTTGGGGTTGGITPVYSQAVVLTPMYNNAVTLYVPNMPL
jgi:hypothetical protein